MKVKKHFGNLILFLVSSFAGLLLCEVGMRFAFDRVDFLSPTMLRDPILGIKLPPHSGGHDEWGFRNRSVPASAEIVALGDSHTYGNCAKMMESWPHVLGQLSGKSVYNLGMGGYGPNQYFHLLQTKALSLKPRVIICGLYLGDDFDNAYRITYGLDHWAFLRKGGLENVDPDIWEKQDTSAPPTLQKRVRVWLSENSIFYKIVVHGLLQGFKGKIQIANATRLYQDTTSLIVPEKHIQEAFRPKGVLRGLDQQERGVREGMRLTIEMLKQMNGLCSSNGTAFVVAVVPTKETVFARYLEHNPKVAMSDALDKLISNERLARKELLEQLAAADVRFVDLLPALEKASETEGIYTFAATDMHPNKNGYRIIAETIGQSLSGSGNNRSALSASGL